VQRVVAVVEATGLIVDHRDAFGLRYTSPRATVRGALQFGRRGIAEQYPATPAQARGTYSSLEYGQHDDAPGCWSRNRGRFETVRLGRAVSIRTRWGACVWP
jgi:hypothetical protein